MEMNVHDDIKFVEIWLTNSEARDEALRERLKPYYASFKNKKYFVAVYESGNDSLVENTQYLLRHSLEVQVKADRGGEEQTLELT